MRVLHVNDVARAGSIITAAAQKQGSPWELRNIASVVPSRVSVVTRTKRAMKGAWWAVGLAIQARHARLLHVHFATVTQHTRWLRRPYFLHLHGSDVRTLRYDARYKDLVERAVRDAQVVYYVTPDLAEHVLDLRPDAELFPVVVDIADVPRVTEPNSPKVVFASRWDSAKGGELQLDVAREVLAVSRDVPVEGLAWGDQWEEAQALGIRMRPKMKHAEYLAWLSSASVIIGQSTGVMGASELESLATNVPVVMPLLTRWYGGDHDSTRNVPTLGGEISDLREAPTAVSQAVCTLLERPTLTHARTWVKAHHDPAQAAKKLQADYLSWERRQ